jgi:23S rRNA (adenine2503-C2)-methyltransferase
MGGPVRRRIGPRWGGEPPGGKCTDPIAWNLVRQGVCAAAVQSAVPDSQIEMTVGGADPLGTAADEFVAGRPPGAKGGRGGAMETYRGVFRHGTLPEGVRIAPIVQTLRSESPEGEVVKFCQEVGGIGHWALGTGEGRLKIESVLIPMIGKSGVSTYTLCVSSQVGCAMGCTFCETAQMGLIRSLSAAEIVGQWWAAAHVLKVRPKNVVFMGMGEPMDNLDHVLQAIAVLTDHNGPNVAMNKITVSTVGRLDGIRRLAAKVHEHGWKRLNLAVSLNAPNDRVRSAIMPINRAMPMGELKEALLGWPRYGGAAICIEYVLIPGVNDLREHAGELAEYVKDLRCCVNLIPYNPRRNSPWPAPEEADVARFMGWLVEAGVFCKRRRTKGRDMMGACGQLGSEEIRKRKLVVPTVAGA